MGYIERRRRGCFVVFLKYTQFSILSLSLSLSLSLAFLCVSTRFLFQLVTLCRRRTSRGRAESLENAKLRNVS